MVTTALNKRLWQQKNKEYVFKYIVTFMNVEADEKNRHVE